MALLKKTLHTMAETMGCGDDENSGTALLSFLVRRNQAEEEEDSQKAEIMKMVGDDDEMELGDESDATNMDTDDPEAGDMDPEMDDEMNADPDVDMDPDDESCGTEMGNDEYSDADIEQEGDDEKRLGMIQSLLSTRR